MPMLELPGGHQGQQPDIQEETIARPGHKEPTPVVAVHQNPTNRIHKKIGNMWLITNQAVDTGDPVSLYKIQWLATKWNPPPIEVTAWNSMKKR